MKETERAEIGRVHLSFFKKKLFIFRERVREGETEGENINVWVPLMCPLLGTWPETQACALTGNQTGDPLVRRLALNALSHTSQGGRTHLSLWEWREKVEGKYRCR